MVRSDTADGGGPTVRVTVGGGARPPRADRPTGTADGAHAEERGRSLLDAVEVRAEGVDVREVGPTGFDGLEPLLALTTQGTTGFHPRPSVERVEALLADLAAGGVGAEDAAWVVEHDPATDGLPVPETGPLAVGRRVVTGRCGWIDPEVGTPAADGAAAAAHERPAETRERLATVGLLGRGRGDASQDDTVAATWETVHETAGDPVVVVNANESDRTNGTDRTLLAGAPAEVLDGALAVAALVGADPSDVVVYTNANEGALRNRTRAAADAVAATLDVAAPQVTAGPDEYIAGEFTMALEAMEGNDRLEARLRPPGPARHGIYGRPTVVHTPRTYAQVRAAVLGTGPFDPDDADPGTRLVTVGGDVERPATVELPTGGSLAAVREAVTMDGQFKMACVGGRFGGFTRSLDHPPSAPALAGADLGTGGAVELLAAGRCAVAAAGQRARFASEANCGRCFPCREGSKQLVGLLRSVYDGDYEAEKLRELTRTMGTSSLCGFGRSAARSVATALHRFETEFDAHAEGRCPSGECEAS